MAAATIRKRAQNATVQLLTRSLHMRAAATAAIASVSRPFAGAAPVAPRALAATTTVTALLSSRAFSSAAAASPQPASTDSTPFVSREVTQTLLSREQAEGVGARVRRSIGRPELRNFDPFLMLDEFNVNSKGGFPDHPHRGFQTVTYMFPTSTGAFEHEDFVGNRGLLKPGTLQWMTAGRGIVHSEMPALKEGQTAHGLQLWINLAAKDKMCEPDYQEMAAEKIVQVTKGGIKAHVIAGKALGAESPIYTRTPVHYAHFFMEPGQTLQHDIPAGFNTFLYTLEGELCVGTPNPSHLIGAHHTVTLSNQEGQTGVTITTYDKAASFVAISGKPLNEPVVQHGPFVMNTREQIMQAIMDYQHGRNGFEKAPGWRSEIGRPITDHM